VNQTTRFDNEVALAWLGSSLEYAHNRGQARLAMILASVRTEIVFEMEPTKTTKSASLVG
jgi:hypothetical protein